ncbi:MAG: DUF4369 domain-containing protein [Chitinophagaceae bacterium]
MRLIVGSILLILNCVFANARQSNGYTIHAKINGLQDGEKVYMSVEAEDGKIWKKVDSALVKGQQFDIKGIVPDGPRFYSLQIEMSNKNKKDIVLFIDNNENINIDCQKNVNEIYRAGMGNYCQIDGSPSYNAWRLLEMAANSYRQNRGILQRQMSRIKDSIGFDFRQVDNWIQIDQALTKNLYDFFFSGDNRPDYEKAMPMIINERIFNGSNHAAICFEVYNKLNDKLKATMYGRKLKEKVALCVGQQFPAFNLATAEGKKIQSSEFFSGARMTIVHFWGFNSYKIDERQQELMEVYKKYHNKGLKIVGVSTDTSMRKWKLAISDLPWEQVSDLKGKNGVVGTVYHEAGNPPDNIATTNVLIDSEGKIIAWDIFGTEMLWYLAKTFDEKK